MYAALHIKEDNRISLNDGVESNREWDTPEYHDIADSGKKKEVKAFTFYLMETEEISERYDAPCFVNGLEAYDKEINFEHDNNLISNEFVVKLCLEHEVKNGDKVVKKELIVALKREIYFVKFIINPKEEDVEPGVVLGRSFLRLTKGIAAFGNGIISIYPDLDHFNDVDFDKANDSKDDWEVILEGIDSGDILEIDGLELPPLKLDGEIEANEEKATKKVIKFRLCGRAHSLSVLDFARRLGLYTSAKIQDDGFETYFLGSLRNDNHFNADQYWLSISSEEELLLSRSSAKAIRKPVIRVLQKMSHMAYVKEPQVDEKKGSWDPKREYGLLWTVFDPNGRLITEDPSPSIPRVAPPKGLRPTIIELHDKINRIETRHGMLERMARREPMHHQVMTRSHRMMRSSVEMTRLDFVMLTGVKGLNEIASVSSIITVMYL
ncbi:hypothetical protein Tco_1386192 [Tanacetum coccineum]